MSDLSIRPTHAYIGRKFCGCTVASYVDLTDGTKSDRKFTANAVRDFILDGLTIERVPLETVAMVWGCPHREPVVGQLPLIEDSSHE